MSKVLNDSFVLSISRLFHDHDAVYCPGIGNGGRLYNAAPGAEAAKIRSGSVGATSMFGSLFPARTMQSRR